MKPIPMTMVTLDTAPDWLRTYRARIDALDDQIVTLLARRHDIIRAVAKHKHAAGIPATLPDRVAQVVERNTAHAAQNSGDAALVRRLYTDIVATSCALEDDIMHAMSLQKGEGQ